MRRTVTAHGGASRRRGVTAVELMIAIALFAIVAAALGTTMRRQQRFYSSLARQLATRAQLRQGAELLPVDLRSLSSPAGDLVALADSALELRAAIGGSVACAAPTRSAVEIPPRASDDRTFTWWSSRPDAGDVLAIYDDGLLAGAEDDRWRLYGIASMSTSTTACAASPYVDAVADRSAPRYRVTIAGDTLPSTIAARAPIRFLRRSRYRLYRSSDQLWYLGWSSWQGTSYATTQPVSGPYRAYSARGATSGLALRYFDAGGAELTSSGASAARVRAVLRSPLPSAESAAVNIAIRNRQ